MHIPRRKSFVEIRVQAVDLIKEMPVRQTSAEDVELNEGDEVVGRKREDDGFDAMSCEVVHW